jgi:hypothetical protein
MKHYRPHTLLLAVTSTQVALLVFGIGGTPATTNRGEGSEVLATLGALTAQVVTVEGPGIRAEDPAGMRLSARRLADSDVLARRIMSLESRLAMLESSLQRRPRLLTVFSYGSLTKPTLGDRLFSAEHYRNLVLTGRTLQERIDGLRGIGILKGAGAWFDQAMCEEWQRCFEGSNSEQRSTLLLALPTADLNQKIKSSVIDILIADVDTDNRNTAVLLLRHSLHDPAVSALLEATSLADSSPGVRKTASFILNGKSEDN